MTEQQAGEPSPRRPGRPKGSKTTDRVRVTVHLDKDVLAYLAWRYGVRDNNRSNGINRMLRIAMERLQSPGAEGAPEESESGE